MIALLFALLSADARPLTYCVGGYSGTPPNVQPACGSPAIRAQHDDWHQHFWVTNGVKCMICFDEEDNSCQTDFTRNNPNWRPAFPFACRNRPAKGDQFYVFEHMIGGEVISGGRTRPRPSPRTRPSDGVTPSPAPAPRPPPAPVIPPAQLTPELEIVTPGPYAVGDTITLRGSVTDGSGERSLAGGRFEVYDGDELVAQSTGTVQRDGSVRSDVVLPQADDLSVRFIPEAPQMNRGDTMTADASSSEGLTVDTCALRARVISPQPGEALASGQSVTLEAALFDRDNQVPVAATDATVRFTVAVNGQPPTILTADSALTAQWTPPPADEPTTVEVFATGNRASNIICHADALTAQFSDLGLGFDTSGLPTTCYTGIPCEGEVVLQRPAPGVARQSVDQILSAATTRVVSSEAGREISNVAVRADDRYTIRQTFDTVRGATWKLEIQGPSGTITMPGHAVNVRPALEVKLPESLDLGIVPAGSSAEDHCVDLDFSASEAAEEHRWELLLTGAEDCRGEPVLATTLGSRVRTYSMTEPLTVEALDPDNPAMTVCLDAPRCSGEVAPDGVQLHVRPLTPVFADQARAVRLTWQVTGRAWWRCHLWWMLPVAGTMFLLWLIRGFIVPARFPPDATVKVAGSEKNLKRIPSVPLRDCPGSGAGFYRDARLGVHISGDVNGQTRNAAVTLQAVRGGSVVLKGGGQVQVKTRNGKWEPVEDLGTGHLPGSAVYRIGESLYFKVDAG